MIQLFGFMAALLLASADKPIAITAEGVEGLRVQPGTMLNSDTLLFVAGSVEFFCQEYKDADFLYTRIAEIYPNSPLVTEALTLAIISKQLSTGGDSRKIAEGRRLIDTVLRK
jgi:hypothetical protein